jgi:signal peptide peptidase SppA
MKHPKILSEDLMLITPVGYANLKSAWEVLAHGQGAFSAGGASGRDHLAVQAKREVETPWGEKIEVPQMEIEDGIAVIPITGAIGRGLDWVDKYLGATDVSDVEADLDEAEESADVSRIILNIDSPGGMFSGTPELSDRIARCEKPVYAFTPGLLCSAAYWLACACDSVFATKSADIGCIGVYTTFLDLTAMAEQRGIKVQVFSSGIYKGMGVPGTALTDMQKELLQERINEMAEMFYEHVQSVRTDVPNEALQGQTFKASAAEELGLIDGIARNIEDVVSFIR